MPQALVIGSPIDHSLSPILHGAGYEALGLEAWHYGRAEITAEETAAFLDGLDEDIVGVSVTMPDKEAALAIGMRQGGASSLARRVEGANTLVRRPEGWWAENTDVAGIVRALADAGCSSVSNAVVLGAGATARSAVEALAQLGVRHVTFVVRSQARATTVAHAQSVGMTVTVERLDAPGAIRAAEETHLLVSTLPAGAADSFAAAVDRHEPRRDEGPSGSFCFDVVYAGWPTSLARVMDAHGARVVSGLEMLIHQAAVQFELFTGQPAPIADMRAAGLAAMEG